MAVIKNLNIVDTLTDVSAKETEISQRLYGEDNTASDSAANSPEDIEIDEVRSCLTTTDTFNSSLLSAILFIFK